MYGVQKSVNGAHEIADTKEGITQICTNAMDTLSGADSVEINQIADVLEPVDLGVHNKESAVHDLLGLIIAELGDEYTVVNAESFSKALGLVCQSRPRRLSRAQFDDMMMWARTKVVPSVDMQVLLMMEERFLEAGSRNRFAHVQSMFVCLGSTG